MDIPISSRQSLCTNPRRGRCDEGEGRGRVEARCPLESPSSVAWPHKHCIGVRSHLAYLTLSFYVISFFPFFFWETLNSLSI